MFAFLRQFAERTERSSSSIGLREHLGEPRIDFRISADSSSCAAVSKALKIDR